MNITGKLINTLKEESGTSKAGKPWTKRSFTIDTGAKYNPIICFGLFGEKCSLIEGFNIGTELNVTFNISSREFGGKYYHNIDAYEIEAIGSIPEFSDEPEEDDDSDQNIPF